MAGVFAVCLGLMLAFFLAVVQVLGGPRPFLLSLDFRAYYTAGRMLLGGVGSDLYILSNQFAWQHSWAPEIASQSGLMPFLNPPFVAVPVVAVAALPPEMAYLVWLALEIGLLALICRRLLATLEGAGRPAVVCMLALVLTFQPLWLTAMQGQLSFVIDLALLASWLALREDKEFRAGLWLAVLLVRPYLILVPALALAWRRRIRALTGMAVGSVAALGISLLLVGWGGLQRYVSLMFAASSWGDAYTIHPQRMHTWRGFLHLLLRTDETADVRVWWVVGVAAALALLLWGWRGRWEPTSPRFDLQWALLVGVSLFVAPHANFHDLSLLVVPAVLIARYVLRLRCLGWAEKLLISLSLLVYVVGWISPIEILQLELQPSVLLTLGLLIAIAGTLRRPLPDARAVSA